MSAADNAGKVAAETKNAWPATRKLALDNTIRARGRELGMSPAEVNKVVAKARERADREWGR
jgi:hypothetical protein